MSFHHRMMLQRYGLGCTTSLYSEVLFDPIFTPIFTAVLGTGGFSIGATKITYAPLASAIATTAISNGLQALLAQAPKPPKPEDGRVPFNQAIPFRVYAVGRTRVAGARMMWEAKGFNLYSVQAIAGHRIKSFNRFYLNDDEVTVVDNVVTPLTTGGRYGAGSANVRLYTRLARTLKRHMPKSSRHLARTASGPTIIEATGRPRSRCGHITPTHRTSRRRSPKAPRRRR